MEASALSPHRFHSLAADSTLPYQLCRR